MAQSPTMDHRQVLRSDLLVFPSGDNLEPELFADDVGPSDDDRQPILSVNSADDEPKPPPPDKYNLVYIISYLLGTSTLLPWYFFITCEDYWMYRFRNLHNATLTSSFGVILNSGKEGGRDQLQADFMSYVSIASTIPSTIFLFVNLFFLNRFSIHGRVVLSFVLLFALFVETTVLILFDTDTWQWCFFLVTLTTVVFLNMATALLQAALCGILTQFPVRYISAFSSSQSLAGILAAVFRIWTLCFSVSHVTSTFIYFTFADIIIVAAFIGYLVTRKTEFYKYYVSQRTADGHVRVAAQTDPILTTINYRDLQKRIQYPCAALFFCFVFTQGVYPTIAALVLSSSIPEDSVLWKFFAPVITYLLYSLCEYLGRISAGFIQKPKGNYAFWLSIARIIFIPLLMLCYTKPRNHLPILIHSDLIYAIIIATLGVTNGYLTNLTFILMAKSAYGHEHEVASSILVIWLGLGLCVGSLISFPLVNCL